MVLHRGALLPFYLFIARVRREEYTKGSKLSKTFFLTTMTSELSKFLNEQLGCIFKCETTKTKTIFKQKLYSIM